MYIKIQGPKGVRRIGQKKNWKTESIRKADSTLGSRILILSIGKAKSAFMGMEQKPMRLFVLI